MSERAMPRASTGLGAADDEVALRVHLEAQALLEVETEGFVVDGGPVQISEDRWAVYAQSCYDGEVIVGEYPDEREARATLLDLGALEAGDDTPST
jgi:hypothetical protein